MKRDFEVPVSVVMPVHNGERHVEEAIRSILNQTFNQFEFVVVDDFSTDRSAEIVRSFDDNRILYVRNEKNLGVSASLNRGIVMSRGKYIARMDDDDVSMPDRLALEYLFLESNAEYVVVGTLAEYITEEGESLMITTLPETDEDIRKKLPLFWFHHGSVMMRKDALLDVGMYDEWCRKIEDLLLWNKLAARGRLYVIPKPLYKWRLTVSGATNVTRTRENLKLLEELKRSRNLEELVSKIREYDFHAEHDQKMGAESAARKYQYNITVAKIFARKGQRKLALKYVDRALRNGFVASDILKVAFRFVVPRSSRSAYKG